ncbi:MAG: PD-(D/E)XK nuclease family protein [Bacteroidaceae bacterium]|nr:PD-(D/E)XK nuclease family protein [Bacteroidaceae bacterium]
MTNTNLNGSAITFEQDGKLSFNEEEHRYSLDGVEFRSVSNVVGMFFREFDAEGISLKKCNGNVVEAARLREVWESKGAVASQAGTFLHKQIEDYLNGKLVPDLLCDVFYEGCYLKLRDRIDISREWSYFKSFERNTTFQPFRTEWRIYDADARIAGTLDFVCCCPDGTYEIYDWKRSNKIDPTETNRWANGLNGLEHLTDTSYIHYCLQQNLYRYMLEKNYGIKVSRMNLVVLHPELPSYRVVPIAPMDREVGIILKKLNAVISI